MTFNNVSGCKGFFNYQNYLYYNSSLNNTLCIDVNQYTVLSHSSQCHDNFSTTVDNSIDSNDHSDVHFLTLTAKNTY